MRKSVGCVAAMMCALVACDSGGRGDKNRATPETVSVIPGVAATASSGSTSSGVSSTNGQDAPPGAAGIEDASNDPSATLSSPTGIVIDNAGNVYVADTDSSTIRKITTAGMVTIFAGAPGQPGYADGTGAIARFDQPRGLAVDASGNVYVADSGNSVIRKITPSGLVTTLAGTSGREGDTNGTGAAARFNWPCGVATDASGNVYVADTGNNIIRKITPTGNVTTLAGISGEGGLDDGIGAAAKFDQPFGITTDRAGNIYVTDSAADNAPRRITPAGRVTTLKAVNEEVLANDDGDGSAERQARMIGQAYGIALDSEGNVYVAGDDSIIRKITPKGAMTDFADFYEIHIEPDRKTTRVFDTQLHGIAIDSRGGIYVAATNKHTIYKITPTCVNTLLAGKPRMAGYVSCY